jgi:hypothetical protein
MATPGCIWKFWLQQSNQCELHANVSSKQKLPTKGALLRCLLPSRCRPFTALLELLQPLLVQLLCRSRLTLFAFLCVPLQATAGARGEVSISAPILAGQVAVPIRETLLTLICSFLCQFLLNSNRPET